MSLVADYTDSEDEGADDPVGVEGQRSPDPVTSPTKEQVVVSNPFGLGQGDEGDPSSSSSDEAEPEGEEFVSKKQRFGEESGGIPLDNPFRFGGDSGVGRSKGGLEGSVLRVEFREEEAQKQAVMERHVKLSSQVTKGTRTINGKKICWNNRKGKCIFGHNCKYAHESDTAVIDPASVTAELPKKEFKPVKARPGAISSSSLGLGEKKENPFSMDSYEWDKFNPIVTTATRRGFNKVKKEKHEQEAAETPVELEDVPENAVYAQCRSRPLKPSKKSEFFKERKRMSLNSNTNSSTNLQEGSATSIANLNQSL